MNFSFSSWLSVCVKQSHILQRGSDVTLELLRLSVTLKSQDVHTDRDNAVDLQLRAGDWLWSTVVHRQDPDLQVQDSSAQVLLSHTCCVLVVCSLQVTTVGDVDQHDCELSSVSVHSLCPHVSVRITHSRNQRAPDSDEDQEEGFNIHGEDVQIHFVFVLGLKESGKDNQSSTTVTLKKVCQPPPYELQTLGFTHFYRRDTC